MEQRDIIRAGSVEEICHLADSFVLAVDLGFSKSRKSCGLAWKDGRLGQTQTDKSCFGKCADKVYGLLKSHRKAVVIVEAPLSGLFDKKGNPVGRGGFEQPAPRTTRYWYSGPGAAMCLAAAFFLRTLSRRLRENPGETSLREVVLYEGFITFKSKATDHSVDARWLLDSFFCTPCPVVPLEAASSDSILPILDAIGGASTQSVAPAIIAPRQ